MSSRAWRPHNSNKDGKRLGHAGHIRTPWHICKNPFFGVVTMFALFWSRQSQLNELSATCESSQPRSVLVPPGDHLHHLPKMAEAAGVIPGSGSGPFRHGPTMSYVLNTLQTFRGDEKKMHSFFEDFEAVTPHHMHIVNQLITHTHTRIITHASFWLMADSSQRN